jgi:hypothetical protein
MSEPAEAKLKFHLQNVDPGASGETVQRLFDEALAAAIEEAGGKSDIDAKAEFEGGFFGAGETVVILWILHALKVGGVAFGTGAATAAGKSFYDDFLAPQLRKRNLLPSKDEPLAQAPAPPPATEPPASR